MTYDDADPSAYLRALWSKEEAAMNAKIENVKALYVESQRDDDMARHLKRLTFNAAIRRNPDLPHSADNRAFGKGLVIVGPSGSGKSTLIQETFKNNAAFPNYGMKGVWCPLLSISAPAPCTLLQIAMRILIRLGYETTRTLKENDAWLRVRDQLRLQRILFLFIDDIQHVLHQLSEEEIQKVRDTLKDLMTSTDWPVQLILSGVPDLLPFARKDRQFRRRLRFMYLSPLSIREHSEFLDDAIREYAKTAGLKLSIRPSDAVVGRLLHAAQYEMGISLEILADAIEAAFDRDGKTLGLGDFADGYASRSLMPDEQNPFAADEWDKIDASRLRPKEIDPEEDNPAESGKEGRPKHRYRMTS
jgi:hypothetical protein